MVAEGDVQTWAYPQKAPLEEGLAMLEKQKKIDATNGISMDSSNNNILWQIFNG